MNCYNCTHYAPDLKEPCFNCSEEHNNFEECKTAPKGTRARWKHTKNVGDTRWFKCSYCGRAVRTLAPEQLSKVCLCGALMK